MCAYAKVAALRSVIACFVVSPAAIAAGVPRTVGISLKGRGIEDGKPSFGAVSLL